MSIYLQDGDVSKSPSPQSPQIAQDELTDMVRPRWSPEKLEQLIKVLMLHVDLSMTGCLGVVAGGVQDKINSKTEGYPAFAAFRLFSSGRGETEITYDNFKRSEQLDHFRPLLPSLTEY